MKIDEQINGFNDWVKTHCDYEDLSAYELEIMQDAWFASANRDGYKLVPVELSTESIKKLDGRFIEVVVKDGEDYQDLYKAMIGAAE